ncbi:endolytic transglycosylase MltG [Leifsonia sp. NPDC058292]|uniref:endolytic transglycosylase MltG n=1 Tax=Leifsonia sp. NPDC058292 TaxID=3346428 RepID=UPI0036D89C5A
MSQNPHPPGTGETTPPRENERGFDPFDSLFGGADESSPAPEERPAPPVFPDLGRPPMTRREAREAREAQERAATGALPIQGGGDAAVAPTPAPTPEPTPAPAPEPTAAPVAASEPVAAASSVGSASDEPTFATFEELTAKQESPLAWRQQNYLSHGEPPKKKRSLKPLWATIIVLAVLGGLVGGAYAFFQPQVAKLIAAVTPQDTDYKGDGTGTVNFTIHSGDTGSDVATNLQKAGVTKTYEAFYTLLLRQKPATEFQPGVFKLAKQMSAQAALLALQDPASKVQNTAVIPEGTAEKDILPIVAEATKVPLADLQAAAATPADYGVPAEAKTLEGFLFPATYTFPPGISAHDAIKTMVDRSFQALDDAGVAPADRWKTIVLASLVQREAGLAPDYPKVSRVFLNRLAQGWDLQSDATVAYGTGNTHTVTTTDAERADAGNPYNTYVHPGLPVGPISNPGDLAIKAALHPADGSWMFFVTWNLETGETIFSTTVEEHDAAVAKWQQWMRDNPGYE